MYDSGFQQELKTVWKRFFTEGVFEGELPRALVRESWRRCREKTNTDPYSAASVRLYEGEDLERHIRKYDTLIATALPIMRSIYAFLRYGKFMVSLADRDGCLLDIIGDETVQALAQTGEFVPGAFWSEAFIGTNGIGTSLFLDQPVQIHGREHFRRISHHWSGSSAPVHGLDGELLGCVSIVGLAREVHPHTLGIVVTAATAIDALLKLQATMRSLRDSTEFKNVIMESISEGLLVVDHDLEIKQLNRLMAGILGVDAEQARDTNLERFLGHDNGELLDIVRPPGKDALYVTDHEIGISTPGGTKHFLVTSRPMGNVDDNQGTVLLFNEISRARSLVQRMSGNGGRFTFDDLIGTSEVFVDTLRLGRKAAESSSSVLLIGESGTGKEMFAQAIHCASRRRHGPFVAVNCGAIPRDLIASEMFGYSEGAFTGARRGGNMGKFELANGGTIFLDEIGEMPIELQTTLLRILETKKIIRVGGNEEIAVDVRIITATNKDLPQAIAMNRFRQDLYYRLNVFTISMIPLRRRGEDIPLLARHFLDRISVRFKKPSLRIGDDVMRHFKNYSWPGNVRELQNVMERIVNICDFQTVPASLLPEEIVRGYKSVESMPVKEYERELMKDLLRKHGNNVTRVAKELGMARSTVYQKMDKYRIDPKIPHSAANGVS